MALKSYCLDNCWDVDDFPVPLIPVTITNFESFIEDPLSYQKGLTVSNHEWFGDHRTIGHPQSRFILFVSFSYLSSHIR